jgi:predicted aldo/keto reductase-like oxidoreductase
MKRRAFLGTIAGAAGGLALGAETTAAGAAPAGDTSAGVPRRVLGRTGLKVSVVVFPGLALIHHDQKGSTEGLRAALDRGVNYFDVAPAYGNGDCETKMGAGLAGIDRGRFVLACKTKVRDKEGARKELERSLERLKTDHFDLYQLHHLRRPDEVRQALGPGGAMEALVKAKEEGKVKHLGFSAHTTKAALLALNGFPFDTVMFPINFVELLSKGIGREVLDLASQKGAAVLGMKTLSRGSWPKDVERTRKWWYRSMETPDEVGLALRFTLSQPGVVAAVPPSFLDLLEKTIAAAADCRPVTEAEVAQLRDLAKASVSVFEKEESEVAGLASCGGLEYPECAHAWDDEECA